MAAQLTSTKGPRARALAPWSARAMRPLPVPVSPWMRTAGSRGLVGWRAISFRIWARMSSIAALFPRISASGSMAA